MMNRSLLIVFLLLLYSTQQSKKEWQLKKTLVVNAKKQFMIWENATCVSMNALHSEKKLCQQDYAIWNTALKKM